ncbi:MAG: translation initiation factor IF-5A [Candidatus Asgardarchaeia archaeon]
MSVKIVDVGSLKRGQYIIINGAPYKVVSIDKSKTGKHGSAKARIVAIGLFDGDKKSIVQPTSAKIETPIIEKRTGMVIAVLPNAIQIMDMETNEYFEVAPPEESDELASKLQPGVQVEYWDVLGKKLIRRLKGSS